MGRDEERIEISFKVDLQLLWNVLTAFVTRGEVVVELENIREVTDEVNT